jgi:1-deoxy-D-xylulose-5-phosphate reductoisomerase
MIGEVGADMVLNGISGSSGLLPSLKAVEAGRDIALANKETIVMAGPLILDLARKKKVRILPIDSEHSAVFNLMRFCRQNDIDEIILTASGGAFRDLSKKEMEDVKPEDALRHPTWKMGPKITIDSATMANKGLEVIEAMHLFNKNVEKIKVVIHPQSIVHAMVRTRDGSLYTQLSEPDMRVPIQNAMSYPDVLPCGYANLDLASQTLTFLPWDKDKYPMLSLAYEAARVGGSAPILYNAANEEAVEAFTSQRVKFTSIAKIVKVVMDTRPVKRVSGIEEILAEDRETREATKRIIKDRFVI